MGTFRYGSDHGEIDDRSLFHLDTLLATVAGRPFQLHVVLGGEGDYDLISYSINSGAPLVIRYHNGPHLSLDLSIVDDAVRTIENSGFVTLPFTFKD